MTLESVIPTTAGRVPEHTDEEINRRIRSATEARLTAVAARAPAGIDERLRELEQEWDVERLLEANASSLALTGLVLGVAVDRRFLALPMVIAAFLLQHAVQGWCPPLPILRRLGTRTSREIENERTALKALRGDFDGHPGDQERDPVAAARQALRAAERG